ncbi:MAG: hypothetical protein UT67_C0002G0009 [Candidatus Magasanikbacteria bacterium GW2011_GWA2_40_10]|uniref:Uncharacterized protein n=1 Tax=Candidatus Magasanikbacteria bacterium GW2011_GWA2_40_10 TaxID=1619037 RepID=A0A0G0SKW4_9BACT|nr:MAG: hypothetical protein UT67_C0002G0009 [Candidatus Magasanikbacteria bacterium GW2011_GWA2_40_10]
MTIHDFIKKRKHLIWWVKNYDRLGAESVVEATLNYGNWDDVQTLIKILGIKKVAKIFREKSPKSPMGRTNYFPEITRYFNLYFNKYAPHRNSVKRPA